MLRSAVLGLVDIDWLVHADWNVSIGKWEGDTSMIESLVCALGCRLIAQTNLSATALMMPEVFFPDGVSLIVLTIVIVELCALRQTVDGGR